MSNCWISGYGPVKYGHHTAVYTSAGELYTFGNGKYGRLGHGTETDEWLPRLVEGLPGEQVVAVAAGEEHTAVCTASGRVYTFGSGSCAKLGHGAAPETSENCYLDELTPKVLSRDGFHV